MANDLDDKASAWRRRMGLQGAGGSGGLESLESAAPAVSAQKRLEMAREGMRRIVLDQWGGDPGLLDQISKITLSGTEALAVLEEAKRLPTPDEYGALEAIVAFDGTRPSFLVKNDRIDFASSYDTNNWRLFLETYAAPLTRFISCVGRINRAEQAIGTAFLIGPTLALTNRHVAEGIGHFTADGSTLYPDITLDFGHEQDGRATHDRRQVLEIVLAGANAINNSLKHSNLDLALLRVSQSSLPGEARDRHLNLRTAPDPVGPGLMVAAVGYPGDWQRWVPATLQTAYGDVIARLLAGAGGSKRFAPGESTGMLAPAAGAPGWTTTHDATTINGNSGSPMVIIQGSGELTVAGLHYGGLWQGERTNFAHVLAMCGGAATQPGPKSLATALAAMGIPLSVA